MEARQLSLLVEAFAVNAEIEGMKATNRIRLLEYEELTYEEQEFIDKSNELKDISKELKGLT